MKDDFQVLGGAARERLCHFLKKMNSKEEAGFGREDDEF